MENCTETVSKNKKMVVQCCWEVENKRTSLWVDIAWKQITSKVWVDWVDWWTENDGNNKDVIFVSSSFSSKFGLKAWIAAYTFRVMAGNYLWRNKQPYGDFHQQHVFAGCMTTKKVNHWAMKMTSDKKTSHLNIRGGKPIYLYNSTCT